MMRWALAIALCLATAPAVAGGSSHEQSTPRSSARTSGSRGVARRGARTRPAPRTPRRARASHSAEWTAAANAARAEVTTLTTLFRLPKVRTATAYEPIGLSQHALMSYRTQIRFSLRNGHAVGTIQWLTRTLTRERAMLTRMLDASPGSIGTHDEVYAAARGAIRELDPLLRAFESGPALSPRGVVHAVARTYRSQLQQSLNHRQAVATVAQLTEALRSACDALRDAPAAR